MLFFCSRPYWLTHPDCWALAGQELVTLTCHSSAWWILEPWVQARHLVWAADKGPAREEGPAFRGGSRLVLPVWITTRWEEVNSSTNIFALVPYQNEILIMCLRNIIFMSSVNIHQTYTKLIIGESSRRAPQTAFWMWVISSNTWYNKN